MYVLKSQVSLHLLDYVELVSYKFFSFVHASASGLFQWKTYTIHKNCLEFLFISITVIWWMCLIYID